MSRTLLLGAQAALPTTVGTASSFSQATVVRLYNSDTGAHLITLLDSDYQGIGSMTLAAGATEFIEKNHSDLLLAANALVLGAKVGFTV
jgi:hypothetical protein